MIVRQIFQHSYLRMMLPLGFASGLPLSFLTTTLQAWFMDSGMDIAAVGALSLLGMPHLLKFLWAPLLDRYSLPFPTRRRGWMFLVQWVLLAILMIFSALGQVALPMFVAGLGLLLAIGSATQDIAIDAYRTDVLPESERGLGVALHVFGYRIAMVVSGGLALVLADFFSWSAMWFIMGGAVMLNMLTTMLTPEVAHSADASNSPISRVYREAWGDLLTRKHSVLIFAFIVLYKLGDATAGVLTTPFLIQLGFSLSTIGVASKTVGLAATLLGTFLGGVLMRKIDLWRALFYFGFLQAVSNLGLSVLAMTGENFALMLWCIGFEDFCGGMGTAVFVSFLMSLCNKRYSASQFAVLTALAAVGRTLVGPFAGWLMHYVSWSQFFLMTAMLGLPGLALLTFLSGNLVFQRTGQLARV